MSGRSRTDVCHCIFQLSAYEIIIRFHSKQQCSVGGSRCRGRLPGYLLIERWRSRREWVQRYYTATEPPEEHNREPAPSHPSFFSIVRQFTTMPILLSVQDCTLLQAVDATVSPR
jgi:hypothetical protein